MTAPSTFRPPRLARVVIAGLTPPRERPWLLADLEDEAAAIARARGARAARRWYRRQVLRSVPPLAGRRLAVRRARRRAHHGGLMIRHLATDLRHAVRVAIGAPWLSAAVVGTLVVGIGATTAVVSLVDAVLLRPLPYPAADRLVHFRTILNAGQDDYPGVNYPDLGDMRDASQTFAGMATYARSTVAWWHDGQAEQLTAARVDPYFANVLGVGPALGRPFPDEAFGPGGPALVAASHGFWRRALGGDPGAIGQTLVLDGRPYELVAVLPDLPVEFPRGADVWLPLVVAPDSFLNLRASVSLGAIGRIAPERSLADARAEIDRWQARAAAESDTGGRHVYLVPLAREVAGDSRAMLLLLSAVVGVVLLIASVNVANLLLGRAQSRGREFAVRAAIGGGTGRLTAQVLVETTLPATAGGLGGVVLAPWLTRALVAIYPGSLPRAAEVSMSGRVIAAAAVATLAAAVFAALPLARQVRRLNLTEGLRWGLGGGQDPSRRRLAAGLVLAQIAVSVPLVFAATLLVRAEWTLTNLDPGFEARDRLVFGVSPSSARYPSGSAVNRYYEALLDDLRALPGVRAAGVTAFLPLGPGIMGDNIHPVGQDRDWHVNVQFISPDLPRALGLRTVAGRAFAAEDTAEAPRVALVNERLAARAFPDTDPVGQRFRLRDDTWEIVGVLADSHHASLWEAPVAEIYLPWAQWPVYGGTVVIAAGGDPRALVEPVRRAVRAIDGTVPITGLGTMAARVRSATAPDRFRAWLTASLAALGMVLCLIGLYGVIAWSVARRRREIGVRLALGDSPNGIERRVLAEALRLVAAGGALGAVAAVAVARWLGTFAPGLAVAPPGALATIAAAFALVCAAAAWEPARRAGRVDPATLLRTE